MIGGIILSSFYWSNAVANVIGGIIVQHLGGKSTIVFAILSTSILTLLTPLSVKWGSSTGLICVRVLMGLGDGWAFPAVTSVVARWIPPHERSMAGAVIYAGQPIGTIFGMTISGIILEYSHYGWPIVFYFFGGVGIVSLLIICILCYDEPSKNPFISESEMEYLNRHLEEAVTNLPSTPWKDILTSKPVWALVVIWAGISWSFTITAMDLPKYMSSVLKFSSEDTGYFSSAPNLTMWIFTFLTSLVSDFLIANGRMSITKARKVGATLSTFGPGIFILAASYAGCDRFWFIVFLTIGLTLKGSAYCSIIINGLDLSPNYAGALMGLVHGISMLSGILAPYVVGILITNQTVSEWRLIFWTMVIICFVSNIIYLMFGSGEVQDWNNVGSLKKEEGLNEIHSKNRTHKVEA